MRLFFLLLTITLLNIFSPVLAASGDVYLVFRPDSQGHYPTTTTEKWVDKPPILGKEVPADSLIEKFIEVDNDKNLDNYKRTSTGIVHEPPVIDEPVESVDSKLSRVIKEKASDSELSDAAWLKLFRATKSDSLQVKEEVIQDVEVKKQDGG